MLSKAIVTLKGVTPLLMHAYPLVPIEALDKRTPQEQAEFAAYRDPDTKELFVPGVNVQRALVSAASYSKGKGRSTLQKTAAACLLVTPERLNLGTKEFKIDSRGVFIPATKGRVIRHRPVFQNWELNFELEWDPTLLKESEVRRIVDDMGQRVGILEFRPERKGPFGRCMVTRWETA